MNKETVTCKCGKPADYVMMNGEKKYYKECFKCLNDAARKALQKWLASLKPVKQTEILMDPKVFQEE